MSGYPPSYGGGYNNYPPIDNNNQGYAPPPIPNYGDNQSCASLYGTPGPTMDNNNYPPAPYDSYSGNSMGNNPYGMNAMNNYPPPPPPPSQNSSMFYPPPPPQQYGGYPNANYPPPPPNQGPIGPQSGMYPNYPPAPNSGIGGPMMPPYSGPPNQGFYPGTPFDQSSAFFASLERYQGTIVPSPMFQPDADCQALNHAMRGAGTNEHALIGIVSSRSNAQRQQIRQQYKSMFGTDLVKQLGNELSGNFKEAMSALFDSPAVYDAQSLHEALNFSREGTLREILLTRSNYELRAIADAYRRMFSKDLEQALSHRVRGTDFKRILISTIQAQREELTPQQIQQARQMGIESIIDRNRALLDADTLYKAGAGKWGTDEKTFNAIFTQRSYPQLRATFEEYQKKYRQDMAQVIRSEFSGDAKDAYLALITCIRDRPAFFAERLHKAISGLGTRDSALIRVIITRSEIDLVQIKERYQQMYNRSLARDVGGDTSGDYKRLLLAIIK